MTNQMKTNWTIAAALTASLSLYGCPSNSSPPPKQAQETAKRGYTQIGENWLLEYTKGRTRYYIVGENVKMKVRGVDKLQIESGSITLHVPLDGKSPVYIVNKFGVKETTIDPDSHATAHELVDAAIRLGHKGK
ncbi:hypothetical protein JYT83_00430 [bacterium AH-315-F18]|nr:hypothetical protein [bacterium AH-315-F18]